MNTLTTLTLFYYTNEQLVSFNIIDYNSIELYKNIYTPLKLVYKRYTR